MTPDFTTVFISWLNLDISFDVCFFVSMEFDMTAMDYFSAIYKALIQLRFSAYVIILVIIVIVASECSSKFAKMIGKSNPVAVLATMILLLVLIFLVQFLHRSLCCISNLLMVHAMLMLQK